MGARDIGETDQILTELGPALCGLGAVQERAHLLLRHPVQLLQEVLCLPLHVPNQALSLRQDRYELFSLTEPSAGSVPFSFSAIPCSFSRKSSACPAQVPEQALVHASLGIFFLSLWAREVLVHPANTLLVVFRLSLCVIAHSTLQTDSLQ